MSDQVETTLRDGIALITLRRAGGNVLTPTLRRHLSEQLEQAEADPAVKGIVLTGAGSGFCPGIDLSEFNAALANPWVGALCDQIENCAKPVIVALHGIAMGAGLELGLAAHARVARKDTCLAMPDVKLGLIPGAGGTQRLPRLVGAQKALGILLSGQVMRAADPNLGRLITQITDSDPIPAALDLAQTYARNADWPRTCDADVGFSDPAGYQAAIAAVTRRITDQTGVVGDIIKCIEAAQLLPFAQGLDLERSLFADRLASPVARAARHLLMAEKFAAAPPRVDGDDVTTIRRIAFLGKRDRLEDLAFTTLAAGFGVSFVSPEAADAQGFAAWLARALQRMQKAEDLTEETLQDRRSRLEFSDKAEALQKVDLIIEDGAHPLAKAPDLPPHVIWARLPASMTVTGSEKEVANRPVMGLRAYRPLATRSIVELSPALRQTNRDMVAVMAMIAQSQKTAILSGLPAGRLGYRLGAALFTAAIVLLDHGASPYAIDSAARALGFVRGPLRMMDEDGLQHVQDQLGWYASARAFPLSPDPVLARLIRAGRLGRSSQAGFYRFEEDRAVEDESMARLLPPPHPARATSKLGAEALARALQGALVNEASRLIEEKALRRACDIDLILVRGFGYDPARGGPLLQADIGGIFYLYKDMRQLAGLHPIWKPTPGIEAMVKEGQGFFGRSVG